MVPRGAGQAGRRPLHAFLYDEPRNQLVSYVAEGVEKQLTLPLAGVGIAATCAKSRQINIERYDDPGSTAPSTM